MMRAAGVLMLVASVAMVDADLQNYTDPTHLQKSISDQILRQINQQQFLTFRTNYLQEYFKNNGSLERLIRTAEHWEGADGYDFIPMSIRSSLGLGLSYKYPDPLEQNLDLEYKVKFPSFLKNWASRSGVVTVRYTFGDQNVSRSAVKAAIDHWTEHTCLQFEQIPSPGIFKPHIIFYEVDNYCSSKVGRQIFPGVGQIISLAKACQLEVGVIIHEIGHALGFMHEQSRIDRDKYVDVNWKNIKTAALINFFKSITEDFGVPYDYYSVMHYDGLAFSSNAKTTILSYDPFVQGLMGYNRQELSFMDKKMANLQYGCIPQWVAKCKVPSDTCKNQGYLGKDCKCICPDGTSGSVCGTLDKEYTAALVAKYLPYNSVVTSEGTVSSPGYPAKPSSDGAHYTNRIVAPACHKIQLTFSAFSIYGRCPEAYGAACCVDGLEVRTDSNNIRSGTWYCGTELAAGSTLTSTTNTMDLFYQGTNFTKYGVTPPAASTGYQAAVKFVKDNDCGL